MNPQVDTYIAKAAQWQGEFTALRALLIKTPLTEELKWRQPCYTFEGRNVVLLQGFKACCAMMFTQGALLKDAKKLLHKPGEKTQAARRLEFTSEAEIAKLAATVKAYVKEAIEIEKAGLEVEFKRTPEPVPEELQAKFAASTAFQCAFNALTPGRQRAYILHFAGAKQAATRAARIEKCAPDILRGRGLSDR
ncbi:MAG TPA: YdeI/OmpD-associated family protein [Prosthecobacter sp.]